MEFSDAKSYHYNQMDFESSCSTAAFLGEVSLLSEEEQKCGENRIAQHVATLTERFFEEQRLVDPATTLLSKNEYCQKLNELFSRMTPAKLNHVVSLLEHGNRFDPPVRTLVNRDPDGRIQSIEFIPVRSANRPQLLYLQFDASQYDVREQRQTLMMFTYGPGY